MVDFHPALSREVNEHGSVNEKTRVFAMSLRITDSGVFYPVFYLTLLLGSGPRESRVMVLGGDSQAESSGETLYDQKITEMVLITV